MARFITWRREMRTIAKQLRAQSLRLIIADFVAPAHTVRSHRQAGQRITRGLRSLRGSQLPGRRRTGFPLAPDALLNDPRRLNACFANVTEGKVRSVDGIRCRCPGGDICVHGDTPGTVEFARALRSQLEQQGLSSERPSAGTALFLTNRIRLRCHN